MESDETESTASANKLAPFSSIENALAVLTLGEPRYRRRAEDAIVSLGAEAIPALVPSLKYKNEAVITTLKRIAPDAIDAVLPLLEHKNRKVREATALALAGVSEERIQDALAAFLKRNIQTTPRGLFLYIGRMSLFLIGMVLAILVRMSVPIGSTWFWLFLGLQIVCQVGVGIGSVFVLLTSNERTKQGAISSICDTGDTRFLGTLALCLKENSENVQMEAGKALLKVLPLATEADRTRLNAEEKQALTYRLNGRTDDYQLALLSALEKMGDETFVPEVEKLRDKTASERIRNAAENCLPYLYRQAERKEMAQNLLRASGVEEVAPETLLRPATYARNEEADRQTLLRNANPTDSD